MQPLVIFGVTIRKGAIVRRGRFKTVAADNLFADRLVVERRAPEFRCPGGADRRFLQTGADLRVPESRLQLPTGLSLERCSKSKNKSEI